MRKWDKFLILSLLSVACSGQNEKFVHFHSLIFFCLFYLHAYVHIRVCVYVCVFCKSCMGVEVRRQENKLQPSVLSFHHVVSRDQSEAIGLSSKGLSPRTTSSASTSTLSPVFYLSVYSHFLPPFFLVTSVCLVSYSIQLWCGSLSFSPPTEWEANSLRQL